MRNTIGITEKSEKLQKIEGEIDEIKLISAKDLLQKLMRIQDLLSMDVNCT